MPGQLSVVAEVDLGVEGASSVAAAAIPLEDTSIPDRVSVSRSDPRRPSYLNPIPLALHLRFLTLDHLFPGCP